MKADNPPSFDRKEWETLVQFDAEIAAAAREIEPFGPAFLDDLAASYLAIREKQYLSKIVSTIADEARAAAESAGAAATNANDAKAESREFDVRAWKSLCRDDPDIAAASALLARYGEEVVDDFAASYLAINEKAYLQRIVTQLVRSAEVGPAPPRGKAAPVPPEKVWTKERQRPPKNDKLRAVSLGVPASEIIRYVAVLAALGGVSGVLSTYASVDPWLFLRLRGTFGDLELLPGIYFALVLAAGVFLWESKGFVAIAAPLVAALAGWVAAYEVAYHGYAYFMYQPLEPEPEKLLLVGSGLAGGLVGSGITLFGVCVGSRSARRSGVVLVTVATGTALGSLLIFMNVGPKSLLPLFLAWQSAIAGCVAYAICRPKLKRDGSILPLLPRSEAVVVGMFALLVCAVGLMFEEGNRELRSVSLEGDDEAQLAGYLSSCTICARASDVRSRLNEVKSIHAEDRIFESAQGDISALTQYAASCRFCTHKADALAAVDQLNAQRDRETRLEEEAAQFRDAHGNIERLQAYVNSCVECQYRDVANQELARLNLAATRLARLTQEANQFASARGDIGRLQGYLSSCTECQFRSAALQEIARLQAEATQFELTICNNFWAEISAAYSYYDPGTSSWFIQGWWNVGPNSCSVVGRFQKGMFYLYAKERAGMTEWGGTFGLCVVFPGPFRVANHGVPCTPDRYKLFTPINIQTEKYTWTLGPPESNE